MEKDVVKTKGKYAFLSKDKSEFIKYNLDKGWYLEFERRWRKKYKTEPKSYTYVNHIIIGRAKNFKILEILIEMCEENKRINESINELIKN
jgi:hypothetical protein